MQYRERLGAPAGWWLAGMFFAVSFVVAVGFYFGPEIALAAGLAAAVVVALALVWFGRPLIVVDEVGLHAHDALLQWRWAGEVRVLDAAATRRRLGPDADQKAWLLVRGYVATSIEVEVTDPADPHPYWLVSTRDPKALAAALGRARAAAGAAR